MEQKRKAMEFDDLKTLFQRFNRKERYHLVHKACGGFKPSSEFCSDLHKALNVQVDPDTAWMGMDYHLDWLSAILAIMFDGSYEDFLADTPADTEDGREKRWEPAGRSGLVIEGNQQDLDLVILAKEKNSKKIHLIMIEAKLDSGWTTDQLKTKGQRLGELFPKSNIKLPGNGPTLCCHLVMMDSREDYSPRAPLESLPRWARKEVGSPRSVPRVRLTPAETNLLLKPVRTGGQGSDGTYPSWEIECIPIK
jgi:hypothetical protein